MLLWKNTKQVLHGPLCGSCRRQLGESLLLDQKHQHSFLPQVGPVWSPWGFALQSAVRMNAAPRNEENPSEREQWGFLLCGEFHQVNRSPFLLRNGNSFSWSSFWPSTCCITLLSNLASVRGLSSASECKLPTLWPRQSCHLFLSKMVVDDNKGLLFLRMMAGCGRKL